MRGLPSSVYRRFLAFSGVPCQQIVKTHRKFETVLRGEERIEVHHADLGDWRILNFTDQSGDVEAAALAPGVIEQLRNQDVFAARHRVCVDAEQGQDAGSRGLHALAIEVDIIDERLVGCAE